MKSTKKIAATISLIALVVLQTLAQPVIKISDKVFGGIDKDDYSVTVTQYDDSKLIIAGLSRSSMPSGNKTDANCNNSLSNVWVLMTDTALNILWDKTFGGTEGESYSGSLFRDNNQIVFCALSMSDSSCEKSENHRGFPNTAYAIDYWVCSMDSNGNKLWDKTIGGNESDSYPIMEKLTDGNYVVIGISTVESLGFDKTAIGFGTNNTDFWAVKISPSGIKFWDKVYGGTKNESEMGSILATENGSFVFAGVTSSPVSGNITLPPLGSKDIWFVKVDSAGNIAWQRRFGGADSIYSIAYVKKIIKADDGGYLLVGHILSQFAGNSVSDPPIGGGSNYDVWVIKTDSMGNKQWDKRYGGTNYEHGQSIEKAPGGGYYVGATTTSTAGYDITEPPYGQVSDYWIFKIDSVGNKIWDARFGGSRKNALHTFILMPDSSIYLCGVADTGTSAVKTEFGYGREDFWVVRIKENFAYTGIANYEIKNAIDIYPNPTSGELQLSTNLEIRNLMVYDILGNVVLEREVSKQDSTIKINVSTLSSGVYLIKAFSKDGVAVRKFVKENY